MESSTATELDSTEYNESPNEFTYWINHAKDANITRYFEFVNFTNVDDVSCTQ